MNAKTSSVAGARKFTASSFEFFKNIIYFFLCRHYLNWYHPEEHRQPQIVLYLFVAIEMFQML